MLLSSFTSKSIVKFIFLHIMAFSLQYTLCFIGLLFLLPFSTYAQTYSNVSLGRSLAADDSNSSWKSPSGEFAFGFQQIGNQGFFLAIWFDKIPEKTIVWSAKRNEVVQKGSRVELTTDGQLVLSDPKGGEIWTSPSADTGVAYAAMLDTGNFVLADKNSANLWQSFDEPTDTLLPTQTMIPGGKLLSRYSGSNYSRGRYQFVMQSDGNLLLYTTAYPLEATNFAYWSTQKFGNNFQVVFNQSGNLYVVARNGSIVFNVSSSGVSMNGFYQRGVLEYDGVFRHYVYPKTLSSSNGRSMAWSAVTTLPSNICIRIKEGTGSGACGFNSYCTLGADQRPICTCPQEYTFVDENDPMKGCVENFVPQSCGGGEESSEEDNLFEFRDMVNTDWPVSDYEHFEGVTEDWCRKVCMTDCFCAVAFFKNGECWKKKKPLSNGVFDLSIGGKALLKVRRDNSSSAVSCENQKKDRSALIFIMSVLLGSSVFVNFLLLLATVLVCFHYSKRTSTAPQPRQEILGMSARSFTYSELERATDGFKEELGCGASGTVYKGVLESESEVPVAVKKLNKMMSESDKEFETEVRTISLTNHKNLVQLLGFCNEGQSRLLVYEYMSNGSLAEHLFGDSTPNWYRRIQVAFGIARGLLYLHEECSNQIIHCDIKPQNILLDGSFVARISDFGLAKHLKTDQTRTTTGIRGTRGYVAPEWFKSMAITVKVDVYSFGILFLELICCRKNYEAEAGNENQKVLADWAYDCYTDGTVHLLVQNDEEAMNRIRMVEKFVMVAIWCIQDDPSLRPTMKKVTQMLEGAVEVPVPPDPNSFMSSVHIVP